MVEPGDPRTGQSSARMSARTTTWQATIAEPTGGFLKSQRDVIIQKCMSKVRLDGYAEKHEKQLDWGHYLRVHI